MTWLGARDGILIIRPMLWRRFWCVALLASAVGARAHAPGLSNLAIQLRGSSLDADLIVSWQEIENIVPLDGDGNRDLSNDEFAAAKAKLNALCETAIAFEADGQPLKLIKSDVQREDTTGIHFITHWEFPTNVTVLLVRSEIIADLQRGHRQIVSVRGVTNALLAESSISRDKIIVEVSLGATAEKRDHTIPQFLWLGIEHIITGWDHLAFLLGLLVVGAKLREAVKIITAFTIAHSLTLALATFDLIRLPSSIVEPAIAASIVYVGVENIMRREYRGRWMLTFAFGLIHGCGFATALRELGIGTHGNSVVKPLVCFNLGVEIGQLAIAAAVLPWVWKWKPKFERRWILATSIVVALVGAYFLLDRTLFAR
jgi:hydrogenase/urease accessory protein HupE